MAGGGFDHSVLVYHQVLTVGIAFHCHAEGTPTPGLTSLDSEINVLCRLPSSSTLHLRNSFFHAYICTRIHSNNIC